MGHFKVQFPTHFGKCSNRRRSDRELWSVQKNTFSSSFCCFSAGCKFKRVYSSSGFLSLPHSKSHKSSLCKSLFLLFFFIFLSIFAWVHVWESVARQHHLHSRDHLRTGFSLWSIVCRLCAQRDSILHRKWSVCLWKALGKILAALRNTILPSSDDENGLIPSADET